MSEAPITGAAGDIFWRYTVPETTAPLLLLTRGRILTKGCWLGALGEFFVAWAPVPKRDKDLEERLIASGAIPR